MARRKTPKIFRTAISDEAKLAEAKKRRDRALRRVNSWVKSLVQAQEIVDYYEKKLGLLKVEVPKTKKAPKRSWLEESLKHRKESVR